MASVTGPPSRATTADSAELPPATAALTDPHAAASLSTTPPTFAATDMAPSATARLPSNFSSAGPCSTTNGTTAAVIDPSCVANLAIAAVVSGASRTAMASLRPVLSPSATGAKASPRPSLIASLTVATRPGSVSACLAIAPPNRPRLCSKTAKTSSADAPDFWSRSISCRACGERTANSWRRSAASPNGCPP